MGSDEIYLTGFAGKVLSDPTYILIFLVRVKTIQLSINLAINFILTPVIYLKQQKVGIFGKLSKLDTAVKEGDRVEVYRPITADPETVERRNR